MCLGSTCRSPQIFGILRAELRRRGIPAEVRSFGIIDELKTPLEKRPAHLKKAQKHSISIMAERGIDITDHVPAHVSDVGIEDYDLVLCADPVAYRRLMDDVRFLGPTLLLAPPDGIFNPFDSKRKNLEDQDLALYRKTASQIAEVLPPIIDEWVMRIVVSKGLIS